MNKVPDVEEIRNNQDEEVYDRWEKYLVKARDHEVKEKKAARKVHQL